MVQGKYLKKNGWPLGMLALLALSAVLLPSIPAAEDDGIAGDHVGLLQGDFFEYEMDASAMIGSLIAEGGSASAVAKDVSASYKEDVIGVDKVNGNDTWSVDQVMMMKCTIVDEEQGITSKIDMSETRHIWICQNTFRPVKVELEQRSTIFLIMGEGPTSTSDSIETETDIRIVHTVRDTTADFPLKVGKVWNTSETISIITEERSRYKFAGGPYSDWEGHTTEEVVYENVSYAVLGYVDVETPAGTFGAFKVSSSNTSGPQRGISYIDKNGMAVRMDRYEDGEPWLVFRLKAYRFQNGIDTDDDGSVDAKDAFPTDRSASVDSDDDGYPDSWNEGRAEADSTSGLSLDKYPNDPDKWDDPSDSPVEIWVVLVCMGAMGLLAVFNRKR